MSKLLIVKNSTKPLSKIQTDFNKLVQKLGNLKIKKEKILENAQYARQFGLSTIAPLETELFQQKEIMLHFLYDTSKKAFISFNKKEKSTLSQVIEDLLEELIGNTSFKVSEKTIAIHDEVYDETYAEFKENQRNEAKEQIEVMMASAGIKIDTDIDMENPEAYIAEIRQKMKEKAEEEEAKAAENQKNRKKTAKQQAKEEAAKQELKQTNKTMRSLYTDLAKRFHPDTDVTNNAENEEMMKKISEAYSNDDMFALLQMHIQHIQANEPNLDTLAEEQLKVYVKILKEQTQALNGEIHEIMMNVPWELSMALENKERLTLLLEKDQKTYKKVLTRIKKDLKEFRNEQYFKAYLKVEAQRQRNNMDIFDFLR